MIYHNDEERITATLRKIGDSYYAGIPSRVQKNRNITKETLLDYDIVRVETPGKVVVYDEKIHGQPMSKYRDINPKKFGRYYYLPIKKSTVEFYRLEAGYKLIIRILSVRNPAGAENVEN